MVKLLEMFTKYNKISKYISDRSKILLYFMNILVYCVVFTVSMNKHYDTY